MIDEKLEILAKIQSVAAPVFLETRINQKLANLKNNNFSLPMSWALGFSLALLVSINVLILSDAQTKEQEQANIAKSFNLSLQNELYR